MDYFTELEQRRGLLDARGKEYLKLVQEDMHYMLADGVLADGSRDKIKEDLNELLLDAVLEDVATEELELILDDVDPDQQPMRYTMGHSKAAEDAILVNGVRYLQGDEPRLMLDCVACMEMGSQEAFSELFSSYPVVLPAPKFYHKLTFEG